jgi:hypothetical protein
MSQYTIKDCQSVKEMVQEGLPQGWEVRCGTNGTKYYDTINKVEQDAYPIMPAILLPEIVNGCPALNTDHVRYVLEIGSDNKLFLKSLTFLPELLMKRTPEDIIAKLKTVTMSEWNTFCSALRNKNKINGTVEFANVDKYMQCLLANKTGGRRRKTKRRKQKRGTTKRRNRR